MERRHVITNDGSSSIYVPEMDEHYHSSHGAVQEAMHVFINHGLNSIDSDEISVFEMGFGTGLNSLLALNFAIAKNKRLSYLGIEAFPVEPSLVNQLNYCDLVNPDLSAYFQEMHRIEWGVQHPLHPRYSFQKIHQKIEDYLILKDSADIIFFDAFGPKVQQDLWGPEILSKMYQMLKPNGILVTYCAMGQFKRDLKSLGFVVEDLPGPPGKRQMTRAIKQ